MPSYPCLGLIKVHVILPALSLKFVVNKSRSVQEYPAFIKPDKTATGSTANEHGGELSAPAAHLVSDYPGKSFAGVMTSKAG